jgi:hypothetical protein
LMRDDAVVVKKFSRSAGSTSAVFINSDSSQIWKLGTESNFVHGSVKVGHR